MSTAARVNRERLEGFNHYWQHLLKTFPAAKTQAVIAMGKAVGEEVEAQIVRQGVDDMFYHVRNHQQMTVGSKGGYSKVSPSGGKDEDVVDRYGKTKKWKDEKITYKQLTYWLERGHGVRTSSALASSRKGMGRFGRAFSVTGGYVAGHGFYSAARKRAVEIGLKAASRALEVIEDEIDWD